MKNTILTIAILLFGFSAKAQVTATYTYDNLHRLTQASYSNNKDFGKVLKSLKRFKKKVII